MLNVFAVLQTYLLFVDFSFELCDFDGLPLLEFLKSEYPILELVRTLCFPTDVYRKWCKGVNLTPPCPD